MMEDFLTRHYRKIIIVLAAAAIGAASSLLCGADNPIEEGTEAFIRSQTGFDIDISPGTAESD